MAVESEFEEKSRLSRFWKKLGILTSGNFSKFLKIYVSAFLWFLLEKSSPNIENLCSVCFYKEFKEKIKKWKKKFFFHFFFDEDPNFFFNFFFCHPGPNLNFFLFDMKYMSNVHILKQKNSAHRDSYTNCGHIWVEKNTYLRHEGFFSVKLQFNTSFIY